MKITMEKIFFVMLLFIPISWYLGHYSTNTTFIFITAIITLIPLAWLIGKATEDLVLQSNPMWGGLINATFGNIIELIIAIFALNEGLTRVVEASIVGSIIGNLLLLIGASIFFGGLRYKEQRFNKDSAGVASTMLIIAVAGLTIPTVYSITVEQSQFHVQSLSLFVALILAFTYIAGLIFSIFTHKQLFDASDEILASKTKPTLTKKSAILLLFIVTIIVAIQSELLVSQVSKASADLGLTQTFVGVVIIAILTNIAEKSNAIKFARHNKLDISLEIGLSSAIQIALFVVPILVFYSAFMGFSFSLVFSLFEVISILFAVMIVNYLSADGKCNWLEGVQLLSVYLLIAIAYYFI